MCGIAGIVGEGVGSPADRAIVERMLETLVHRGPDDGRVVVRDGGILGARRLSIVDVAEGRQPVESRDGRRVVALNGEIYDHDALRKDLESRGHRFETRSDTEVLLRLLEEEGDACLDRLEGMYAFAAYDAKERVLLLARDRLGEKPLVWFETRGRIVFASEWRALAVHPDAPHELDDDAVALHLLHRFVPAPRTAIRGVRRLPPAHALSWRDGRATVRPYWRLPVPERAKGSFGEAVREVRSRLEAAVASRARAEVPVGVFLSGGVDSGAIAALTAREGRVVTFTLRPKDPDFDEGDAARAGAEALGAEHHEVPVGPEELEAGFDEVLSRIDEPIGDSSLVPTLLLAREARRHVKVVLGGEGADELYGGYPTYLGARWAATLRGIPGPIRRYVARHAGRKKAHGNVSTGWLVRRLFEGAELPPTERHLAWFGAFTPLEQRALFRPEARPALLDHGIYSAANEAVAPAESSGDPVDALLRMDLLLHLPDALLAKVDRTTMLVSLEARAPFLARDVVEHATRLPGRWKVKRKRTKVVLRKAIEGLVSPDALRRRKRGFAVPLARAFEGFLGDRLADRLSSSALARERFDPAAARGWLDEHRTGLADHGRRLYTLLTLLEWEATWRRPRG